jgi:uncharacterized protein (DUF983 family)
MYKLVCPDCGSDNVKIFDGGSTHVLQCKTCVDKGHCSNDEVISFEDFNPKTWLKEC